MEKLMNWISEEIENTRMSLDEGLNNRQKCFHQGRLDALEEVEERLKEVEENGEN